MGSRKKFLFLVDNPKRGGGLKKKIVAVENLDIFCLRRHIQILMCCVLVVGGKTQII